MSALPEHEVYALRYARNEHQTAAKNFIDGDAHDGPMPLDYFMWLIRGPGGCFLVDTGFDQEAATARRRTLLSTPGELLEAIGTAPGDIRDVIITHLHYDHAGNRDLFRDARFHLQDREIAYATGRCMCHASLSAPFDGRDVAAMVMRVHRGGVCFHDNTSQLAPGIVLHRIGGHTDGLQVVRVWTRRGWIVLASDASHFYANIEQGRSFPIVYNLGDMYEGHRTCYALATQAEGVIPGHDPLVMARYPALTPALAGKIAVLHADPTI